MIEVIELESTETPEFKEAVKIYETVFPPEQRVEPEYFISSLAGSMENVADPNERRHFLVSRRSDQVNGMATFTYHPGARLGFLCYLAVAPDQPGESEVGAALGKEVLRLVNEEGRNENSEAIGCVVEVDRPELAGEAEETQAVQEEIDRLTEQGWTLLEQVDYYMPPLHEGEEPIPLQLMYHPLNDEKLELATFSHVVRMVYRDVYGLAENDPLLQRALKNLNM